MASGSSVSVSVEVVDSVALKVKGSASEEDPVAQSRQIVTEVATQMAPSFNNKALFQADGERQSGNENGLPLSNKTGIDDAVWGGIHIIRTATSL